MCGEINQHEPVALERRVLRLLCTRSSAEPNARGIQSQLATYTWRDPDNRIVFEALGRLAPGLGPAQLREELPAQAARMGFPDLNWEIYLRPGEPGDQDLETLVAKLLLPK